MKGSISCAKLFAPLVIMALLTIGFAYGQWTETLTVSGTVTTGEVEVTWTGRGCYDEETYASITNSLTDPHTILVTIDKAYPGYTGHCWAEFTVGGTIPIVIEDIRFDDGNLTGCEVDYADDETGSFTASCKELEVKWTDGLCTGFNPGGSEGSIMHVAVLDEAEEDTTYTYAIHYDFLQANASSCP